MAFNLLRMGQRRFISTSCRRRFLDRTYEDRVELPAPRVRFVEDAELGTEMKALRAKEAGDWKALSVADKQQLYRLSFHRSYSEMMNPKANWSLPWAEVLLITAVTTVIFALQKTFVRPPLPESLSPEWQEETRKYEIAIRNMPMTGPPSKWDY
ncbi:cytochrome c oxidase subunit 4 isoform 1, mitochondrial-like [Amphiura filiformis]|uniref:cytochrome c oxidase subunit 4 isoform 1, mitochondrial-like n=1 Tax=Amphiura filiformis TaxID=82378 RepID=UPI003B217A4D